MDAESDRMHRYLEDELEECRVEDVKSRLAELDMLQSTARSDRVESDLAVLSTLGNETRYRLARVLADAEGELCVCELNAVVDVSESAISHALSDLREAGLVTRRKDGRWRKYEATPVASAVMDALAVVHQDE